ncbi:MAG: hypothetical protein IT207_07360 [Fimbriimonadaceae bacterium]|nr:hypothetical protein [Fimbriimonadaceae bacterium]
MTRLHKLALTAAMAAISSLGFGQANVFGVNFNGEFFRINNVTGSGVSIGPTGQTSLNNLFCWHGSIYTIGPTGRLFKIDPTNGSVSVGTLYDFGGKSDVRATCSDAREEIWAVVDSGSAAADELWRIPAVGQPVFVGLMGSSKIQGLMITFDDRMFAWDVEATGVGGLRTVNRLTGATTDVNPALGAAASIQELYAFGNAIRGIRDELFSLNPTDGSASQIGSGGYTDIRGAVMHQFFMKPTPTVKLGKLIQGNDASLTRRDGDTYDVQKFLIPNQIVDPINIEFKATLPSHIAVAEVDKTRISYDCRMDSAGAFRFELDALNTTTGQFENVQSTGLGTANLVRSFSHGASDHVSSGGVATWRVRVKPSGPVANALFALKTDYFGMDFTMKD